MSDQITPNMSLRLPTPGITKPLGVAPAGESWMELQNTALSALDSHNHSPGKGIMVPSSGINVNAPLPFNSQDATGLRSARFSDRGVALGTPSDVGCIYLAGGELYFNSGSGAQIQITSGGALNAASIGAIGGDYATSGASESYSSVAKLFSFESAAGVKAGVAAGPIQIVEPVSGGKKVTLRVPTGLGADYQLTLPTALPASTKPLTIDSSGQIAPAGFDAASIGLITTANAWALLQTFNSGAYAAHGDILLSDSVTQGYKKVGGTLLIGTTDDQEVQFIRNGAVAAAIHSGGNVWLNGVRLENASAINLAGATSDPAGRGNGDLWFRSDTGKVRARVAGADVNLATEGYAVAVTAEGTNSVSSVHASLTNAPTLLKAVGRASFGNVGATSVTGSIASATDNFSFITGNLLFLVPVGYRPASDVFLPVTWFDASQTVGDRMKTAYLKVAPDGSVRVHSVGVNLANGDFVYFHTTPSWDAAG
jgi:hypothetical protein